MSTQVLRRRGTTVEHSTFVGGVGESTYNTDVKILVAHDGATLGGFPAAHLHVANIFSQPQTISVLSGAPTIAFDIQVDALSRFQVRKTGFTAAHRQEADVSPSSLELSKRGTTGNALAALSAGSGIGAMFFRGWDGTAMFDAGSIRLFAIPAWTGANHGTKLFFNTVPSGSTLETTHATLDSTALEVTSRLLLPNTTSATVGGIYFGGSRAFHNFGTDNTFAGVNAGNFTLSGASNTAVGVNAGLAISSGNNNTFFGNNAGLSNTSGTYNNFFGRASGQSNTTGGSNTFFGFEAGKTNNGASNSFFGRGCGLDNTTGGGNCFFGINSGANNTIGTEGCFFGSAAGFLNTTGNFNLFFGTAAGYANLTGGSNTFFGSYAGFASTASNNTLFGFRAGDNITSGANNLILGYNIDAPVATASNQLSIGNLIFGTGVDGTGTTISSGNVGIGVITPLSRLHVGGLLRVDTGFFNDAGGFKHARVTTGSVGAGSTALVTITWTTAFADANYTVNASVLDSTTSSLSLSVVHIESITAAAVTVRVLNNAVGSLTGTVHVIAVHD